ncbi:DUF3168 domain-containing protein [Streptomyces chartreusis]|uniref:DUF3168 domain-containing protein n=1 Tax=Streptomyces chartreusis TaxID=1969 RepID=UPI003D948EAC
MATALRPLQTAVFAKLNAVPLLTGRVHSELPELSAYPCVQIGSIFETPDDSHDGQGLTSLLTIHVWSKAPGNGELFDFFAAVDAALDRVPLAVSGWSEVRIKHIQHEVLSDPDPDVRHINARYDIALTKE